MQPTDIAGMPDLIALREVLADAWIEPAVGVGEEADAAHGANVRT